MKKIVVFSGAGISAESGLGTFRDSGGIWEKYKIEDVATPEAFKKNPSLVMDFYNQRRTQLLKCQPNPAHISLVKLQEKYNLSIITQNVDDLHERSGVNNVLHLHGVLTESKSIIDGRVYPIHGTDLNLGDLCNKGGQRKFLIWKLLLILLPIYVVYPGSLIGEERIILIDKNPVFFEYVNDLLNL